MLSSSGRIRASQQWTSCHSQSANFGALSVLTTTMAADVAMDFVFTLSVRVRRYGPQVVALVIHGRGVDSRCGTRDDLFTIILSIEVNVVPIVVSSHFQVTLGRTSPSRSVTLAVSATPTIGCCADRVTSPSSSRLVTMMATCPLGGHLVLSVDAIVGGNHCNHVHVVPARVCGRLVVGHCLEGEIAVGARIVTDTEVPSVGALQRQATVVHVASIITRCRLGIRRRVGVSADLLGYGGVLSESFYLVGPSVIVGTSCPWIRYVPVTSISPGRGTRRVGGRDCHAVALVGVPSSVVRALGPQ